MKYYTEKYYNSYQFYSSYFLPDISLEHYIIREIIYNKMEADFDEAKAILVECYEEMVEHNLNKNVYFFSELSKYLLDEKGNIVPLNEYNFLKLRLYATKFLDIVNEAENAICEEMKKIEYGEYSLGIKELAKLRFHDYDVVFLQDEEGVIAEFYYEDKIPYYVFRFNNIEEQRNLIIGRRITTIIFEELFEENGRFNYNILFGQSRADSNAMLDISLVFEEVEIIKNYFDEI